MTFYIGTLVVNGTDDDLSGYTIYGGLVVENGGVAVFDDLTQVENGSGNGPGTIELNNGTIKGGAVDISGGFTIDPGSYGAILDSQVTNTVSLSFADDETLILSGTLDNTGSISLSATNFSDHAYITVASDGLTLSGVNGVVSLASWLYGYGDAGVISDGVDAATFENVDNTIEGGGIVGDQLLTIVNDAGGVIDANQVGQSLVLAQYGLLQNYGLAEATAGDALQIGNASVATATWVNESGGVIKAVDDSAIYLNGPYENDGEIDVLSGSIGYSNSGSVSNHGAINVDDATFQVSADDAAWTNQSDGTIKAVNGATLDIGGPIDNEGQILVDDATLNLTIDGALTGAGTIATNGATVNLYGSFTLEQLGAFSYSAGSGDAVAGFTNTGSSLNLYGAVTLDTVDPTITWQSIGVGDTIDATQGLFDNLVLQNGAVIKGGTVFASATWGGATGVLSIAQGADVNLVDAELINTATMNIGANAYAGYQALHISGEIYNSGVINLDSVNWYSSANINVLADGLILAGGGQIAMDDFPYIYGNARIVGDGVDSATLENVDNTIRGGGTIGDADLMVKNDAGGVIEAAQQGQTLYLANSGLLENYGLAEATDDNSMQIGASGAIATWTNEAGGFIKATGQSILNLQGPYENDGEIDVLSGSVGYSNSGSASNHGTINVDDATFVVSADLGAWTNQADGTIKAVNGATLDISGPLENEGQIVVDDSTLDLTIVGPLSGAGTIATEGAIVNLRGSFTLEQLGSFGYSSGAGDVVAGFTNAGSSLNLYGTVTLDTVDPAITLASVGVGDTLDATQGFFANLVLQNGATIEGGTVIASAAAGGPTGVLSIARGFSAALVDTLLVNDGTFYLGDDVNERLYISGEIDNTGTIALTALGFGQVDYIQVSADGLKLSGGGVVSLAAWLYGYGDAGFVSDGADAATLENVDNTIEGGGFVGDQLLTIVNDVGGVIDANQVGQSLVLAQYGLLQNYGLAEATAGDVLQIGNTGVATATWVNEVGGVVKAVDDSALLLNGPYENDGEIDVLSGSVGYSTSGSASNHGTINIDDATFLISADDATWTNQADGTIKAVNGATLDISGPLDNEGQIVVDDSTLNLTIDGALTGAGTIATNGATVNLYGSFTLEQLGAFSYSAGSGDAVAGFTNTGSSLNLYGAVTLDTVDPTITWQSIGVGDTIDATQGLFDNLVLQNGSVIKGGTVIASAAAGGPTGVLSIAQGAYATLVDTRFVNAGTINIGDDAYGGYQILGISGAIDNSGTIALNSTNWYSSADIVVQSDGLTLTGGGVVTMDDVPYIYGNAQIVSDGVDSATFENVDNTIRGGGTIGDADLMVKNDASGVIDAAQAGQALYLANTGLLQNYGLVEATGGNYLQIDASGGPSTWTNELGGFIKAIDDSMIVLDGPYENDGEIDVLSGSVGYSTSGSASNHGAIDVDDATFEISADDAAWTNQSDGTIKAVNGAAIYVSGPLDNEGQILVDDSTLNLTIDGALTGAGTIAADDSTVNLYGSFTLEQLGSFSYSSGAGDAVQGFSRTGSTVNLFGTVTLDTIDPTVTLASVGVGDTIDATQGFLANLVLQNGAFIKGGTVIASAAAGGPMGVLSVAQGADAYLVDSELVNAGTMNIGDDAYGGYEVLSVSGEIDNSGVITLNSNNWYSSANLVVLADGLTLTGGGEITMDDNPYIYGNARIVSDGDNATFENVDNTIRGGGTLGDAYVSVKNDVDGSIIADFSQVIYLNAASFTNDGTLEAANGDVIVSVDDFTNFDPTTDTLTGGRYIVGAYSAIVMNFVSGSLQTLDAFVDLQGIGASFADADDTLTTIDSGATLELDNGASFYNVNPLDIYGSIVLSDSTFGANGPTSTIHAGGSLTGNGWMNGTIIDNGDVEASGGTLRIDNDLLGSGRLAVDDGAALYLAGASQPMVTFVGTGTLTLGNTFSFAFAGAGVTGLQLGDTIDLVNVTAMSAELDGTTLTVDTGPYAPLSFNNMTGVGGATLTNLYFWAESDGNGGTDLIVEALPQTVSVSYFLAHQSELDGIGTFYISDTWANIAQNFDALNADTQIGSIEVSDPAAPTMTLTVAAALADTRALSLLTSGSSAWSLASDPVTIADTTAAVNALTIPVRRQLGLEGIFTASGYTNGVLKQSETWDPQNDFAIRYYKSGVILNQAYASYVALYYYPSGFQGLLFLNSNDDLVAAETFGAAGARQITAVNPQTSQVVAVETVNSDASFDVRYYRGSSILGVSYASYDLAYSPSGVFQEETFYDGSDDVLATKVVNSSGAQVYNVFNPQTGQPVKTYTLNADGSYDTHYYTGGVVFGQAYASYDTAYSSSRTLIGETFYDADDNMVGYETLQSGVRTITLYDQSGLVSKVRTVNADGSAETAYLNVQGQNYGSDQSLFDASMNLAAVVKDLNTGGGLFQFAENGLTVSKSAAGFSATVGADTFALAAHATETISAAGYSNETIALASGFGATTVTGFAATGGGHDTLSLQLSMFDSSWFTSGMSQSQEAAALLSHATGTANTILTDVAGDQLVLYNVTKTTLAANLGDFAFT